MFALVLVLAWVCSAAAQLPTNCGVPAITPTLAGSRIVSQTEAIPNSWPWQVQVRVNGGHWCGASVLTSEWFLTAAHCVESAIALYSFRAGRHTKSGANDANEQISSASQFILHEDYIAVPRLVDNDVALVRLRTPYTLNDYVSPVCLTDTDPANGTAVWVTGWGAVEGTCCANKLKQAAQFIVDRETCRAQWLTDQLRQITTGMVCAGTPTGYPSICGGDSGGPLVMQAPGNSNQFIQVGIVSWGYCIDETFPNVYANVAKFKPWIVNKLKQVAEEEALGSRNVRFQPRMGAAFRSLAKSD